MAILHSLDMAPEDHPQSLNIAHWTRKSEALMHGRINSATIGRDVADRLRRVAPSDPQSCYYYLQRVAERFDTNKDGVVEEEELRAGLAKKFGLEVDDGQMAARHYLVALIVGLIAGDGGFQFTMNELSVAVMEQLPLLMVIWNDA